MEQRTRMWSLGAMAATVFLVAGCMTLQGGDGPESTSDDPQPRMRVVEGGIGGPATRGDWDSALAEPNVQCGVDEVRSDDIADERAESVPESGWRQLQAGQRNRCGDDFETLLFRLTNCERQARGLSPLECDLRLVWAGREHSKDMRDRDYFSHRSPEGVGPDQRLTERGVQWQMMSENIAMSPTMALAHTGWMESDGHRANILRREATHGGVGVIKTTRGYVVTGLYTAVD